jgi:hypothetical protein
MEIKLDAVSPVVFSLMNVGALADIRRQLANKNEYREKIPVVTDTLLVFRGVTKVGVIPRKKVAELGASALVGKCRIIRMEQSTNTVVVEVLPKKAPT